MRSIAKWIIAPLLALAVTATLARAADSMDSCTHFLETLPRSVGEGQYVCVMQDLVQPPDAPDDIGKKHIATTIGARGTLDCLGHSLTYHWTVAIYSTYPDVTVRNCTIRSTNNSTGLILTGARSVVENNVVEDFSGAAVRVSGPGSLVRGNTVRHIGLGGSVPIGISTRGDVDVLDNYVHDLQVTPGTSGNAYGINVGVNDGGLVSRNRVRRVSSAGSGIGYGIAVSAPSRNLLRDNRIVGDGGANTVGVLCPNSSVRVRDNILGGVATGLRGCGDIGGNDVSQ